MRNERAFTRAYDVLGCLPPTYEPRATGHVPEMVALMERLIELWSRLCRRAATSTSTCARSRSTARSSGQRIDDMLAASDSEVHDQAGSSRLRHVEGGQAGRALLGHALGTGPARAGTWSARRWLPSTSAPAFDIHGGGLDLIFPHHENEIAQSKAAGDGFANYWLHNAWVTTSGEKMSKSLGNSLLVDEVVRRVRPVELRYYLAGAHYRSMLEYSDESVAEAGQGYRRIEGFCARARELLGGSGDPVVRPQARPAAFDAAMDDDIAVPQALAVLHETVRRGNAALAESDAARVAAVARCRRSRCSTCSA